ncbi:hypothetical protein FPCIR_12395 [Fusarium pseudocircinatum]|uniref:Uncharacterized protein n=1 Tax=Fusarium pseudocircinatum TaxID=56676 RepID=A0A8H5KM96_9HYPO|nr:hypothetical protein FPCIR_12395 [Fusarium pseudocircinatum]
MQEKNDEALNQPELKIFGRRKRSKIKGREEQGRTGSGTKKKKCQGRGVVEMLTAASDSSLVVVDEEIGNLSLGAGEE